MRLFTVHVTVCSQSGQIESELSIFLCFRRSSVKNGGHIQPVTSEADTVMKELLQHNTHIPVVGLITTCMYCCRTYYRYRQPFLASRGNPYMTVNIPVFSELDPLILWTRVVKFYMAVKTKSSVSTLCCLILCSFVDADNICDEKYPLLPKKVPWRRTRRPYLCCQFRQCMNFSPKRVRLTSNRSTNSFVEEMGHSSSSSY